MQALQTLVARGLVRLAAALLPPKQADSLREATRPIWRPGASQ